MTTRTYRYAEAEDFLAKLQELLQTGDRRGTRLTPGHIQKSRMPSSPGKKKKK